MMRKIIHTELIIAKTKISNIIERLCTVGLISLFYRIKTPGCAVPLV